MSTLSQHDDISETVRNRGK